MHKYTISIHYLRTQYNDEFIYNNPVLDGKLDTLYNLIDYAAAYIHYEYDYRKEYSFHGTITEFIIRRKNTISCC